MSIKRKDIRAIIDNENLDAEAKAKSLLDLIHSDMDELRDRNDELQTELDKVKKDLTDASNAKDKAVKDLEDYKTAQSTKDTLTAKQEAYKALLKAEKVSDKRIATIIKATDFGNIELDKDGKLKDEKKLSDGIKSEWADFIEASGTQGAGVQNPPNNGGKAKTKEEIMAIKDTHERQQAMIENHELFGI